MYDTVDERNATNMDVPPKKNNMAMEIYPFLMGDISLSGWFSSVMLAGC